MNQVLQFTSTTTNAPVQFAHDGRSEGLFTRYLTLRGERAYRLSFSCGTCAFLFERLGGFDQSSCHTAELDAILKRGVTDIDSTLFKKIALLIPAGEYRVLISTITPQLVAPCAADDYFSHEQVDLWGVEPTSGLPLYPRTEYYRVPAIPVDTKTALFQFIAPMQPRNWLDEHAIQGYERNIENGDLPTALAISILDVKQPATWKGDPAITKHYCLAHFLLDGHHKVFAASKVNKPISLLSFIACNECIASQAEIEQVISVLTHAGQ